MKIYGVSNYYNTTKSYQNKNNLSFEGKCVNIPVCRLDHNVCKTTKKPIYTMYSSTPSHYEDVPYIEKYLGTDYVALTPYRQEFKDSDMDTCIRRAIKMCDEYNGGKIEKTGNFNVLKTEKSLHAIADYQNCKVYFTDPGEKIYLDDKEKYNYIVYAQGAHDSSYNSRYDEEWDSKADWERHGWVDPLGPTFV